MTASCSWRSGRIFRFWTYGPKERAHLRQRLEKRNLRDLCIAGYNNFTGDLEHGEVPQREIQIYYITELARLAHDLGGSLVRIFTAYENPAGSYTAQWNLVVGALKECAKRAGRIRRDDRRAEPPRHCRWL